MKTVSYIVTLYNKEPHIPIMLEGLRAQTGHFEKQYVFVDDGSQDRSVAVLREITAGWPRVTIIEQRNAGPSLAFNKALGAVMGDYVKPVDGDDVLAPWATRRLIDAMERTGCALAYGAMPEQGRYSLGDLSLAGLVKIQGGEPGPFTPVQTTIKESLHSAQTNPSAWLATRRVVDRTSGCDIGVFVQDYSMELRLAAETPFARINGHLLWVSADAAGRVSSNHAQILHDLNLALVRFLRDRPDLEGHLVRRGLRRAAGRAWAWARRHGGRTVLSRPFFCYALARAGMLGTDATTEAALCAPFCQTDHIRSMPSAT